MSRKGVAYAAAMTVLLALYVWLVGARAVILMQTGNPAALGIGAAVAVIPLVTVWFAWKEWRQAQTVSAMYAALEAEGGLVADELPRLKAGRVDKDAALAQFPQFAQKVEDSPEDWRSWFHLGWAYDAAGDRRRARTALRRAADLFRRVR